MFQLHDISKTFGERQVLRHCNLTIDKGEVVGLVGKNGAGKSTLFQIIMQEIKPDAGSVQISESIGYLPQYPTFGKEETVAKLFRQYQEFEIDTVLHTVGLTTIPRAQNIMLLSGGEKTRLFLAKIVIANPAPTLLLLDEPTNNLDLAGLLWLEEFIATFEGAVFLTSHDRQFLDNAIDTTIELRDGELKKYGGNYSFYREQKEIEQEAYERQYDAQQKKIKRIEEDISRMEIRARTGEKEFGSRMPYQRRKIRKSAEQMASRRKRLEKFLHSEKKLEEPEKRMSSYIRLSGKTPSGKILLHIKKLSKSFENRLIIADFDATVTGTEHVWISGNNGSGKSTLLKIIMDELSPDSGSIEKGVGISIGYYSQERDDLDSENTILDELTKMGLTPTESYKVAINFRFQRNELMKKIKELSIGQRAKVSFAKLTAGNYQLLLLDEPTNNLEIETREVIEDALRNFRGALLIASHDRYFLEQIGIDREINELSIHSSP
ncbi:ABC-F family ATP-binding cassette domain-containing protein [Candidatus Roizmanbacteria bacterium]|nr:ABC-F family ATP-binding cassette domain-containing protein [Candidatus Roizmanbacteria bacterium]